MSSKVQPSPLTSQVTATVLVLAVISLAILSGFGFFATVQTDQSSLARQKVFVANGLREQVESVQRQQRSVTVWDDSVLRARAHNEPWMAENLGAWMFDYYGHDRVYVIDPAGRPVHAMQGGKTLPPGIYEADKDSVAFSVRQMRDLLARQEVAASDLVVAGYAAVDGRPAILSIQPLVPSSDRVAQQPGDEYLHIDIQFIDQDVVDGIAAKYLLTNSHMQTQAQSVPDANVPLVDTGGGVLGYFVWEQDRPGLTLVKQAGPALVVVALLAAGVLVFLLKRLRRASTALQISQDEAQYLAFHDTLTGLPNRALFEDRLRQALLSVSREKRRVALLYLDLDRFKHVNDTLGHPAGDELVRQAAARLSRTVREVDTVARLGGDEFAIIVVDIRDVRTAEDLCERLLHQISQPFDIAGNQVFVGVSIGVAVSPDSGADPADLLRKSDIALYEAKKNGRGRYQVFAGDMDDILARKRIVESDLRVALTTGQDLRLCYQPIYAPDCRTIVGAEALVRWDHPVHGALSPAHFVTIAEERGMVGLLGEWTLREAVAFATTVDLPWVALNISPLQVRDDNFADLVLAIVREAGLDPSRLELEITESVLLEDSNATRAALETLRRAGIRVALDDFGTGYSSINYLRRHAIDKLKIDRSFVRLLGSGDASTAIVKAMIDLARAMRVDVTAEGVETSEQRDLLVEMGCNELQGFLLSMPLTAAQMRQFVGYAPLRGRQPAVGT